MQSGLTYENPIESDQDLAPADDLLENWKIAILDASLILSWKPGNHVTLIRIFVPDLVRLTES
jgi:hypothetical protein